MNVHWLIGQIKVLADLPLELPGQVQFRDSLAENGIEILGRYEGTVIRASGHDELFP